MNSATSPSVVVSSRLGNLSDIERRIEAVGADVISASLLTHEEIQANAGGAQVVIIGAVEPFDAVALSRLPQLHGVVRRGVGINNVDVQAATERGIVVMNVPDASVEEVSDHALTLLLALERRLLLLDASMEHAESRTLPAIQRIANDSRRFQDLALGIVGLGRIGGALARKAASVYGRVLAYDPHASQKFADTLGVELVEFDALLHSSDHISLHVPLTASTRHLLGSHNFCTLKKGVVLVNTSRGGLIDEAALLTAMDAGIVSYAGLDVTAVEPVPDGDPMLDDDRVLLTGHSAAWGVRAKVQLAESSVDAAIDILRGTTPANIINRDVLASQALRVALSV